MKSTNENLYSFWCLLGDSETYNDYQDITFAPAETKITLSSLIGINTSNLPSDFNDSNYLLATLWKDSDTEIVILYDYTNESLVAWCKDTNTLIASGSDAIDLTLLVVEGKTTKQIFDILFVQLRRIAYVYQQSETDGNKFKLI